MNNYENGNSHEGRRSFPFMEVILCALVLFICLRTVSLQRTASAALSRTDSLAQRVSVLEAKLADKDSTLSSGAGHFGPVSVKIRCENAYVEGTKHLPDVLSETPGTVTVSASVDIYGQVSSVDIDRKGTTIQDDDVQYACREAALKTGFNTNVTRGRAKAVFTYTFKGKED